MMVRLHDGSLSECQDMFDGERIRQRVEISKIEKERRRRKSGISRMKRTREAGNGAGAMNGEVGAISDAAKLPAVVGVARDRVDARRAAGETEASLNAPRAGAL